jgi:hypothetical protein
VDLRAAEILTGSDCARAGAVVRLPRMPGYSSRLTQEPTRTRSAFEPGSERAGLGIRLVSMLLKLTPSVVGAAGVTQPSPICSRSRSSRSSNPTASPAADRARLRRARHALRGRGHFRSPIAHARDPAATSMSCRRASTSSARSSRPAITLTSARSTASCPGRLAGLRRLGRRAARPLERALGRRKISPC